MSQVVEPSVADRAREALGRHAWRDAFDLLSQADGKGLLGPEELELLAQSAWWVGRLPLAIEARERAYAAAIKSGEMRMAVEAAINLGHDHLTKNAYGVATGWLNRAERLLEGQEEGHGHGWLAVTRALHAVLTGNLEEALAQALRAQDVAARVGDRDLQALALSSRGATLIAMGQVEEGLAILDEASVDAVAGDLAPAIAGGVSCTAIGACASLGEWRRAAEWTEAQDRWCQREGISGYPGTCRLHRAEIKRLRGAWLEAESEARRATDELEGFMPAFVGLALAEIGWIRLLRGDLPAAEEALTRAHQYGRDPEPTMSLLLLAQGKVDAAAGSIRRALDDTPKEPSWWAPPATDISRLSLLPAQVEIALAAGDTTTARVAADRLASLAERYSSLPVRAGAATCLGAVLVAEGDPVRGAQALRRGIQLWGELDAPYDAARAQMLLAGAYAAQGDQRQAAIELGTARSTFERLGATLDLRRADEMLAGLGETSGGRQFLATERGIKTFMFTDIVDSTKLAELLGDEAWDNLIRWHDQTLRSIVAEHGGQEVKATGDGFFVAFPDPDRAIDAAIAMQRRLAEQRQGQGFAPAIRIGLHTAEATRAGLDYIGTGVNQAARIGASAQGSEILVSAATAAAAKRKFAVLDRRTIELKGISAPVEVASIAWR